MDEIKESDNFNKEIRCCFSTRQEHPHCCEDLIM